MGTNILVYEQGKGASNTSATREDLNIGLSASDDTSQQLSDDLLVTVPAQEVGDILFETRDVAKLAQCQAEAQRGEDVGLRRAGWREGSRFA